MSRLTSTSSIPIAFFLLMTFPVRSQTQQQPDQPIRLSAEIVVLDVQVLNKKTARIVGGLDKKDFSVYEDGVAQQLTQFGHDKLPLSIVLLLDVSQSVRPVIDRVREGAMNALNLLKPEDEVAVMAFASKANLIQGFTTNRRDIVDAIERMREANVGGGTLLDEGVYQAASCLRNASNATSRRVIIAVTDDVSGSGLLNGKSRKEALDEVLESGAVVCGLIVKSWMSRSTILTDTLFGWKKRRRASVRAYADETGGEVSNAGKEDVAIKLRQLIEHLRARYTLGYVPSNQKQDGKFRKIKVTVSPEAEKREGKLAVVTRKGYFARQDHAARSDSTK